MVLGSDDAAWTLVPHTSTSSAAGPGGRAGALPGEGLHAHLRCLSARVMDMRCAHFDQALMPPRMRAGPWPGNTAAQVVEEEVFENECFVPLRGWSHTHLLAGDRLRFNRGRGGGGDSTSFPQLALPPPPSASASGRPPGAPPASYTAAWEWEGAWEVEVRGHVDRDGWAYGHTWAAVNYPFAPGCGVRRPTDLVRRRRWVRRRVLRDRGGGGGGAFGVAGGGGGGEGRRRVLGVLAPGASLALPFGWSAEGCDLQMRPLLFDPLVSGGGGGLEASWDAAAFDGGGAPQPLLLDEAGDALHGWSLRNGLGSVGIDLSDLQDGSTHLLCCGISAEAAATRLAIAASLQDSVAGGGGHGVSGGLERVAGEGQAAALTSLLQPQWLSVTVESDPLVMAQVRGLCEGLGS